MKLITTKDYLLLIDEEKYKTIERDCFVLNKELLTISKSPVHCTLLENQFKIIAYYPLTKDAQELDLPLLPNPFKEINIEDLSEKANGYAYYGKPLGEKYLAFKEGFIEGYKAATKQFSLEDVKEALSEAFKASQEGYQITADEIIQLITTQQLPVSFEPEYEEVVSAKWGYGASCDYKLKTITNSEGKEVLVGTYIH